MTSRRLVAVLAATTVLPLTALSGPPAAVAAGDPVPTVITTQSGLAGSARLGTVPPTGGPGRPFGPVYDGSTSRLLGVAVADRAPRLIAVERTGTVERVVLRDLAGALLQVLGSDPAPETELADPLISPDGSSVAWSRVTPPPGGCCSSERQGYLGTVAGGVRPLAPGTRVLSFAGTDLALVADASESTDPALSRLRTVPAGGGADGVVTGLPLTGVVDVLLDDDAGVAVLRGSSRASDGASSGALRTAPVVRSGSSLVIGPAIDVHLAASGQLLDADLSPDGSEVWFVATDPREPGSDLYRVPVLGGTVSPLGDPTPFEETSVDGVLLPEPVSDVANLPAPVSVGPALVGGTTAVVPYALPRGTTSALVRISRVSPGRPTVVRDLVAPAPLRDSGLEPGRVYEYRVALLDASGRPGPRTALAIEALELPLARFPSPTSTGPLSPPSSGPLRYATDARFPVAVITFGRRIDVDWRRVGQPGTTAWLRDAASTYRIFGNAAVPPTIARTVAVPGATYVFASRTRDRFGNPTAWRSSARAVVPLDDTAAVLRGSANRQARTAAYFLRSSLLGAGATASVRLRGDLVQVVGERGPRTGAFDVYLDGVHQARVDTRFRSRAVRQVLWSTALASSRSVLLTVRAVGTAGRPTVVLDGFSQRAR